MVLQLNGMAKTPSSKELNLLPTPRAAKLKRIPCIKNDTDQFLKTISFIFSGMTQVIQTSLEAI